MQDRKQRRLAGAAQIQIARIEQTARLQVAHGREQRFFQMRIVLFDFTEEAPDGFAHGAGPQRTAARNDRRAERFRETGW